MNMFVISLVLFAISIGLSVWSVDICKKTEETIKETRAKYESAKEEINRLESQLKKTLNSKPEGLPTGFSYWLDALNQRVVVVGEYKTAGTNTVLVKIKTFPFDDDLEFAKREAQELLDHLNEK